MSRWGVALPLLLAASDFEDGTSQGWNMGPPSIGVLVVVAEGNPGYCLEATDTMPGGAPLLARAPAEFTGDLTKFESIQWDEFVLDYGSDTVFATSVLLRSSNGSIWSSSGALGAVGSWNARTAPFIESAWTYRSGSDSFSQVLADVEALFISMDTSYLDRSAIESRIDNVRLTTAAASGVPETPGSSWGAARRTFGGP